MKRKTKSKAVIVPPQARRRVYPFAEMIIGSRRRIRGDQHRISSAAQRFGKRHKMQFNTRKAGAFVWVYRVK